MSVRSNGAGDQLSVSSAIGIGTGAVSVGFWHKIITARGVNTELMDLCDVTPTGAVNFSVNSDSIGTEIHVQSAAAGYYEDTVGTRPVLTVGTWYWLVASRSGSTIRLRVFDDSTSTTPVWEVSGDDAAQTLSGAVIAILGPAYAPSGEWCDAEYANFKIHVGVAWTNAQCRTESQTKGIQTAGGTKYGSWRLRDIDADTDGINDFEGSRNLTNSGFVNGASEPLQLSPREEEYDHLLHLRREWPQNTVTVWL